MESAAIDADRLVEFREPGVGQLGEEHSRALVRDEALPLDLEFVRPGFAAEDGVVLQHQTGPLVASLPLKKECGGEAADAAAYHHAVILLAGFLNVPRQRLEDAVANPVPGSHHVPRIPVGPAVVSQTSVSVPIRGIHLREQIQGTCPAQQQASGTKQRRVQIVAA